MLSVLWPWFATRIQVQNWVVVCLLDMAPVSRVLFTARKGASFPIARRASPAQSCLNCLTGTMTFWGVCMCLFLFTAHHCCCESARVWWCFQVWQDVACVLCVLINKLPLGWTWRVTGLSNMVGQTIDLNALYQVRWAHKSMEFIWSVLKAQEVNAHCQGFIAMVHNSNQGTGWLEIRLLEGKSMLKIVWPWFITRIQVQGYRVVKALGSGCIKFNTLF